MSPAPPEPVIYSEPGAFREETRIVDYPVRANEILVGDEIIAEPFAGRVSQVDTFDLNSGRAIPPSSWPCLRIYIEGQGGIARFPHELVQVTGTRWTDAESDDYFGEGASA